MMLKEVTHNLVHYIDRDGTLIAVSSLNDSGKLKPLAIVVKCPGKWIWQRTKYRPTDFTLNDLLQGTCIKPVLEENVFVNKFNEMQKGKVTGSGEVEMPGVSIKAQGQGTSNILLSLGTLYKETLKMANFLKDSKKKKVNLQHSLITQLKGKNLFFTVVKERIFTTSGCSMNFSRLREGSWSTSFFPLSLPMFKVNNRIGLKNDRDVAIEIPKDTVLAYSVSELCIKCDGHYEVVVSPNRLEADNNNTSQHSDQGATELDGFWPVAVEGSSLNVLNEDLAHAKATLCGLMHLPPETRFSLFTLFQEILPDQKLLFSLECKLQDMCDDPMNDYLSDTSGDLTDKFLDLLLWDEGLQTDGCQEQGAPASWQAASHPGSSESLSDQRMSILTAMHMLISAAEELTEDSLSFLKTCSLETIAGLNDFLTHLTHTSQQIPLSELPFPLRNGEVLEEVKQLFDSSNITLKIHNRELHAEMGSRSQVFPLVLYVVIHGLACFNDTCEIDVEI